MLSPSIWGKKFKGTTLFCYLGGRVAYKKMDDFLEHVLRGAAHGEYSAEIYGGGMELWI